MTCPRCKSEQVRLMVKSPVLHAWEVYVCDRCCYSWRSTEQIRVHEKFLLDEEKINAMQVIPPIPPLDGTGDGAE